MPNRPQDRRWHTLPTRLAALALLVSLVAIGSTALSASASTAPIKIAFLSSSAANGFNQAVYAGIKSTAATEGATATIFDGQTSGTVQYNQLQTIIADKSYNAVIIAANDGPGIAGLAEKAIKAGIKVAAVNNSVGPNLVALTPQIAGLTTTVGSNQTTSSEAQAQFAVQACQKYHRNPCNIVIMDGNLSFPFDKVRSEAWHAVFRKYSFVHVIAEVQGQYEETTSLHVIQDTIAAHPHIDLVISAADQEIFGAQEAFQQAHIAVGAPNGVLLLGRGAATDSIPEVRCW